jgi:hypothetical protein
MLERSFIVIIVKITCKVIFVEKLIAAELVKDCLYVSVNPDLH